MTATESGNVARLAAQPVDGGGTPAPTWVSARRVLPVLDLADCPEAVVVGAHPDDETLGFGGTAALLADAGVRVQIMSASDGGAAYPGHSLLHRYRLERTRRQELFRAARVLGVYSPISLGLPDGEINRHEDRLADLITEVLATKPPGTWCVATWRGDGHPDHEAVGRAAATAVARTEAVLLEYPVWMWHWAVPDDPAVPWSRAHAAPLTGAAVDRKRLAVQSFQSQFTAPTSAEEPVLPPSVVQRFFAVGEVIFR